MVHVWIRYKVCNGTGPNYGAAIYPMTDTDTDSNTSNKVPGHIVTIYVMLMALPHVPPAAPGATRRLTASFDQVGSGLSCNADGRAAPAGVRANSIHSWRRRVTREP